MRMTRRKVGMSSAAALTTSFRSRAAPNPSDRIRIGYPISLSGPFKGGAATTTLSNYRLWVRDVNARGGIRVGSDGRRLPVEVIEYDDASKQQNAIALTEKLIREDKVDFVLPPWGTGMNLAVAPAFREHGFPQIASTAVANSLPMLARQFPTTFFMLAEAVDYVTGLLRILVRLRQAGHINNKIVMLHVADQFGADLAAAAEIALDEAGFAIALDRSYPVDVKDLTLELQDARASGADSFICYSYMPDTLLAASQARSLGYNPKIFYTAVGTAFAAYKQRLGRSSRGVMGIGGADRTVPTFNDYVRRFFEVAGHEPDGWAAPGVYASLQCLEQAIEAAGTLDRREVIAVLRRVEFDTVVGRFDLKRQIRGKQFLVGQWQDENFVGIAPDDLPGARPLVFPKAPWSA